MLPVCIDQKLLYDADFGLYLKKSIERLLFLWGSQKRLWETWNYCKSLYTCKSSKHQLSMWDTASETGIDPKEVKAVTQWKKLICHHYGFYWASVATIVDSKPVILPSSNHQPNKLFNVLFNKEEMFLKARTTSTKQSCLEIKTSQNIFQNRPRSHPSTCVCSWWCNQSEYSV